MMQTRVDELVDFDTLTLNEAKIMLRELFGLNQATIGHINEAYLTKRQSNSYRTEPTKKNIIAMADMVQEQLNSLKAMIVLKDGW